MTRIIITTLAELREGDAVTEKDGKRYPTPLIVAHALGPIEPGSPVEGVRLVSPAGSPIDWVFYPSQMDGHALTVERP